jgi:hypothetical protein
MSRPSEKYCNGCKQTKPAAYFGVDERTGDGLRYRCRACVNSQRKNVVSRTPRSVREEHLKKKFGLTLAAWVTMFEAQGRQCAICGATEPGRRCLSPSCKSKDNCVHGWATDHDHSTNKVRAILCNGCNLICGFVERSPLGTAVLSRVDAYLEAHRC